MSQWLLVCCTLLITLGSMSRARSLGSNSNLLGINGGIQQQLPKEELELESLKEHKVTTDGKKVASGSQSSSTPIPQIIPKAALNMEHPTQSDNDNENSGKLPPKSQEDEKRKLGNGELGNGLNPEADYTPKDIAEYIFWTGDQSGVALAINDFLQEKLVTKEDVIRFLEDVKLELNQLKNRYSTLTQVNPIQQNLPSFSLPSKNRLYFPKKKDPSGDYMFDFENYNGLNFGGKNYPISSLTSQFVPLSSKSDKIQSSSSTEEDDYEELRNGLNVLRQADAKNREYSLEEIIYQLAKELFSQELQEQPQHSVQRFAHFLENEAALGRIPKDLGKAVLDTLVGALIDAVNEQGTLKLDSQQQQPALSISSKHSKPTEQPHAQKQPQQNPFNLKAGK